MASQGALLLLLLLALAACSAAAANLAIEHSLDGKAWSKAGEVTLLLTVSASVRPFWGPGDAA